MPKLKTKSSAKKRFKVTKGGIKFSPCNHNHILTKKKSSRKARLCKMALVHDSNKKNIANLLNKSRAVKGNAERKAERKEEQTWQE